MNMFLVFLTLIPLLGGQLLWEHPIDSLATKHPIQSAIRAQELQTPKRNNADSSDGAMEGVDLSRTRVYQTKGTPQVTGAIWQSKGFVDFESGIQSFGAVVLDGSNFLSFSEPMLAGRMLFFVVSLRDGYLVAMDGDTGSVVWKLRVEGGGIRVPAVAGETAYTAAGGTFYALDARTGRQEWKFKCKGGDRGATSPAVSKGVVYFGCSDGKFYALGTETGKEKWASTAQGSWTPAALAEGSVFIASKKGLYALDSETGVERWNYGFKGDPGTPVYGDGVVYLRTKEGELHAIDAKTGQPRWKVRLGGKKRSIIATLSGTSGTSLALYNETIYFGGMDRLYAVETKTGELKWEFETGSSCRSPVVADGVVYIGGIGKLTAVDAKTGQQVGVMGSAGKNGYLFSSPAISNGVLYLISSNGHVYAMK